MFNFTKYPEPTLTYNDTKYTGINILELLDTILTNSENYPNQDVKEAKKYFDLISLYYQHPQIPILGFKSHDTRAIIPNKRIIDIGFDLTIIDVYKKISDKIIMYETGISLKIPVGYYVELIARSSISKTGYMLANNVGIIDPGYTDTVKVPLIKLDDTMPDIQLPLRIAQLILKPYCFSHAYEFNDNYETTRGTGGFGSTN